MDPGEGITNPEAIVTGSDGFPMLIASVAVLANTAPEGRDSD